MMLFNYLYIRQYNLSVIDVPKKYRNIIVFRALAGFWGIQGTWAAFRYMPLNLANCILMMGPIPIAIAARLILKESMRMYDIAAMIMSLAGIFIINNPFAEKLDPN